MRHEIRLPPIGADITEVRVVSVLVAVGSILEPGDVYMHVSTDKIDIEVDTEYGAVVLAVRVRPGDIVSAGDVLLEVDSEEPTERIERGDETANVRIGLRYLGSREPHSVCSRKELRNYNFSAFEMFVRRTALVASAFRELDLLALDPELVDQLRAVLFQLTRLVSEMDGFTPERLGLEVLKRHQEIKWRVGVQSEEARTRFEELFALASGRIGAVKEDPYVFISYSQQDRAFVNHFKGRLAVRKIRYFLDEKDIEPGHLIVGRVHEELRRATHALVLVSGSSLQSQWVAYEIGYARGRDIAVVPYIIYPGITDLPGFISGYRYLLPHEEDVFLESLTKFPLGD